MNDIEVLEVSVKVGANGQTLTIPDVDATLVRVGLSDDMVYIKTEWFDVSSLYANKGFVISTPIWPYPSAKHHTSTSFRLFVADKDKKKTELGAERGRVLLTESMLQAKIFDTLAEAKLVMDIIQGDWVAVDATYHTSADGVLFLTLGKDPYK